MKSSEFDALMRRSEAALNVRIPAGWIVTRIDGRGFSRLTKETVDFEAPYDTRFHAMMVKTVQHLMGCGFSVIWGYTQSDEISLLHRIDESSFGRRLQKFTSVLASEAGAVFSLELGIPAAFDCRAAVFEKMEEVEMYFRWRMTDAERNAVGSWCYWSLRKEGLDAGQATQTLRGMSVTERIAFLDRIGVPLDRMPLWQKVGTAFEFEETAVSGTHPLTGETTESVRRTLMESEGDVPTLMRSLTQTMHTHVRPARRGNGWVGK